MVKLLNLFSSCRLVIILKTNFVPEPEWGKRSGVGVECTLPLTVSNKICISPCQPFRNRAFSYLYYSLTYFLTKKYWHKKSNPFDKKKKKKNNKARHHITCLIFTFYEAFDAKWRERKNPNNWGEVVGVLERDLRSLLISIIYPTIFIECMRISSCANSRY